ncbi:hypothetical protein [Cellulomonas sp. KRMCY2]|uniref:hypothetical protein n=1 Tax=Cellulomonas sp. KRMCY2 TaxID=1304865 RepID=UPI0005541B0B|nr:hypothetical protein [Cellulomonas sp. KRMCY2]
MSTTRRRFTAFVLVVVGIVGLGVASAAQLTVGAGSLGAGTAAVASCQPAGQPISVGFTTTTFSAGQYQASAVTLGNVNAACAGLKYRIQPRGAGGAAVGSELTGTVTLGTGGTLTATFPANVPASTITGVDLVIHS